MSTQRLQSEENNLVLFRDEMDSKEPRQRALKSTFQQATRKPRFSNRPTRDVREDERNFHMSELLLYNLLPGSKSWIEQQRSYTCSETCSESSVSSATTASSLLEIKLGFHYFESFGSTDSIDMECTVSSSMSFKEIFPATCVKSSPKIAPFVKPTGYATAGRRIYSLQRLFQMPPRLQYGK
ncbi:ubiquitin family protein [Moniliophthora roreri]|nr:ubiquitin family protein [Moniliophthora roreri]